MIKIINKLSNKIISPKCKHFVWLIFIFSLIFPIAIFNKFSIYNYLKIPNLFGNYLLQNPAVFNNIYNIAEQDILLKNNIKYTNNDNIYCIISLIWISMIIYFGILEIKNFIITNKSIGKEEIDNKKVINVFENCKKELKIKRKIKLINPINDKLPGIYGIFNIKIIITEKIAKLNKKDLRNIFMHELSHYKRKDNVLIYILTVLKIIYWFNPVIIICINDIVNNLEFATDELAIKKMEKVDYIDYCKTIVKIINNGRLPKSCKLGLVNDVETMIYRINFISNKDENEQIFKFKYFATCIISFFILLFLTPTVYSEDNKSELYISISNNEILILNQEKMKNMNEVCISKDDYIKIWSKNHNYIGYTNLISNEKNETDEMEMIVLNFEKGEYLYKFELDEDKNFSNEYLVKIIVK